MVEHPSDHENIEEILSDLLHETLDIRKKAFFEVKKYWSLEVRPYLWKVIENEKEKQFQYDLVKYVIDQLEGKSIRKMIRFIENGQLFPKAQKYVLANYFKHETQEIRIALQKSILRAKSTIQQFVADLIISKYFDVLPDDIAREFLNSILTLDSVKLVKSFTFSLLTKKPTMTPRFTGMDFIKEWGHISCVKLAIFETFLKTMKNKNMELIWSRNDLRVNDKPDYIEIDNYFRKGITSRNDKIRYYAIKMFSYQINSQDIYQKGEISETQLNLLFDITQQLDNLNMIDSFLELNDYSENSLSSFFTQSIFEGLLIYSEMRTFELHPYAMVKFIIATEPRRKLIKLIKDDPNPTNRTFSLKSIKEAPHWIYVLAGKKRIVGPYSDLSKVINHGLTALLFENDKLVITEAEKTLQQFISLLKDLEPEDSDQIIRLLDNPRINDNLSELRTKPYTASIAIRLSSFITKLPIVLSEDDLLHPDTSNQLLHELIENIELTYNSVIVLVNNSDFELKYNILKLLKNEIENKVRLSDSAVINLSNILQHLNKDDDIKIRSRARLLINKIQH